MAEDTALREGLVAGGARNKLRTMLLKSPFTLVILGMLAIAAAPADAVTRRCRIGYYAPLLDKQTDPAVTKIRAVKLPRRTDGYASPCLVAESIAGEVQRLYHDRGKPPKQVQVFGARWGSGVWHCRYAARQGGGEHATCRRTGKRRRIEVDLR
jgi:hypothetical protein